MRIISTNLIDTKTKQNFNRLFSVPNTITQWDPGKSFDARKFKLSYRLIDLSANNCNAAVTNGIFKRLGSWAYARSTETMSIESGDHYEWSVELIGSQYFYVGIATRLDNGCSSIQSNDPNAILFNSNRNDPIIFIGTRTIHSGLRPQQTGDIIRFAFNPVAKKLEIDIMVRVFKTSIQYIRFQNQNYEIDLQDNMVYFAVVQSAGSSADEAHLLS